MSYESLKRRKKGSRKLCGCTVHQDRRGRPMVKCVGGTRFASRREAVEFFQKEQAQGSFCVFTKKRSKRRSRRRR